MLQQLGLTFFKKSPYIYVIEKGPYKIEKKSVKISKKKISGDDNYYIELLQNRVFTEKQKLHFFVKTTGIENWIMSIVLICTLIIENQP